MHAFLIELENQVGELARITEAIAAKDINITGFSGSTCGDGGTILVLTDDDASTKAALQGVGCSFSEQEIVEVTLQHVPGTLAKAARRLAEAGVNIDAAVPTGMDENGAVVVGFVTNDPAKTRSILSTAGSAAG
jgi:hypothetical protein